MHQNRLVLVGSIAVPDLVMASKSNEWEDFALTELVEGEQVATAASGFWFEQTSSRNNPFNGVLQQEGMFIFGGQGESTIPAGPFTAATVEIRENSWFGSEQGLQPLIVGGQALFVQRGGRDMRGIRWTEAERKYEAPSLREMAGDVFGRVVDFTVVESSDAEPTTVYVVDEDGHVAVLVLRRGQPELAWSTLHTEGNVKAVAASGDAVVFLVERDGSWGLETFGGAREGEPCLDAPMQLYADEDVGAASFDIPSWMRESACLVIGARKGFTTREAAEVCQGDFISGYSGLDDTGGDGSPRSPGEVPYFCVDEWSCQALEPTVRRVSRDGSGAVLLEHDDGTMNQIEVPLVPPLPGEDPEHQLVFVGSRFTCGLETLPFTVRSESGTKLAVLKSRIFGLVIVFGDKRPAEFHVNGRSKSMQDTRKSRRGRIGQRRAEKLAGQGGTPDPSNPTRVGSLSGWRRRSTLALEMDYHCFIRSLNYRASG